MRNALALMAAGGTIGAATHAAATTETFNYSGLSSVQDVTLGGASAPQFTYGLTDDGTPFSPKSVFTPENGALVGAFFDTQVDPYTDTTYNDSGVTTGKSTDPSSSLVRTGANDAPKGYAPKSDPGYVNVKFEIGSDHYIGTAFFSGDDATLGTISYDHDTSAAPEPAAWALLTLGVGVAGAALRRRRAHAAALAA